MTDWAAAPLEPVATTDTGLELAGAAAAPVGVDDAEPTELFVPTPLPPPPADAGGTGAGTRLSLTYADGRAKLKFVDDGRGRRLVASKRLPAGALALRVTPYAAVLLDSERAARCDWQLAKPQGRALLRCSKSQVARFASRESQRAAWAAYYREECASLVACSPRVPPPTARLAARVLWRRRREDAAAAAGGGAAAAAAADAAAGATAAAWDSYAAVESLEHHWGELGSERMQEYAGMAQLIRAFMRRQPLASKPAAGDDEGDEGDEPVAVNDADAGLELKEIAVLLARFSCNIHTICDDELRPIGVGLYPLAAMVNHSCRPSCTQSFVGRDIVFRALRPLAAGEELTISYVDLLATRQERRRALQASYFFDIDRGVLAAAPAPPARAEIAEGAVSVVWPEGPPWPCDDCDRQLCAVGAEGCCAIVSAGADKVEVHCWGALPAGFAPLQMLHAWQAYDRALERSKKAQPQEAYRQLAAAVRTMDAPLALGEHHVVRTRTRILLFKCAIDIGGLWEEALALSNRLTPSMVLVFPPVWSALGLHLAAVAKLEMLAEHPQAAMVAAKRATEMLEVTGNSAGAVGEELRRTRAELRGCGADLHT